MGSGLQSLHYYSLKTCRTGELRESFLPVLDLTWAMAHILPEAELEAGGTYHPGEHTELSLETLALLM